MIGSFITNEGVKIILNIPYMLPYSFAHFVPPFVLSAIPAKSSTVFPNPKILGSGPGTPRSFQYLQKTLLILKLNFNSQAPARTNKP